MKYRQRLISGLAACIVATFSNATYASERQRVQEKLPLWLEAFSTPAAGVAYIEDGKLLWTEVAGEQSAGVEATQHTLFNVASLAKPLIAETVLQFVEEGELTLDSVASEYWLDPDLAGSEWLEQLTVEHLLSHQGGFPNWRAQTENKLQFQFEPGSRSGYSGEGYEYLGKILENLAGKSFTDVSANTVMVKVGASQMLWYPAGDTTQQIAYPMGPEGKYGEPSLKTSAADDLYTTVDSYGRFAAYVMNKHLLNQSPIADRWNVSHNLSDMVCQPERLANEFCPKVMGFSLGWSVFEYANKTLYIHGGGDWGERAMVVLSPDENKGVVVLTNGATGMKVVRKVMSMLLHDKELDAFIEMQGG